MLPNSHDFFRHFWYPVMPSAMLSNESSKTFTLLDEPLVMWRTDNEIAVLRDRCCHRSAKLSCGKIQGGSVHCPYHGWVFNNQGNCINIPQQSKFKPSSTHRIPAYQSQERYGYIWVALADPLRDIPDFTEENSESYRRIPCFYEQWDTSAFRVMENELDMAHFSFVHILTFGSQDSPVPLAFNLTDVDPWTIELHAKLATQAPEAQAKNTGMPQGHSSRTMDITWFMPFIVRLDITYDSGLRHVIINCSTPITGEQIYVVQFHYRNDSEAEVSAQELIAFESKIAAEDRSILEIIDPNVNLYDFHQEAHIATDKPGLMMRRKLVHAIQQYEQNNL